MANPTTNRQRATEYVKVDVMSQGGTAVAVAAALADDTANPTVSSQGSMLHGFDGTTWDRIRSGADNADGVTALALGLVKIASSGLLFNGTTWDRDRNNIEGTALASAARTATTNSSDITNYNARGILLAVDFTATPNNAETMTVGIQAKDPVSGKYVTMTAFTALTASALGASPTAETYLYTLYPGGAETAATAKHEVQALSLPRTFRVQMTHSAGGSWTYSVGYSFIL